MIAFLTLLKLANPIVLNDHSHLERRPARFCFKIPYSFLIFLISQTSLYRSRLLVTYSIGCFLWLTFNSPSMNMPKYKLHLESVEWLKKKDNDGDSLNAFVFYF